MCASEGIKDRAKGRMMLSFRCVKEEKEKDRDVAADKRNGTAGERTSEAVSTRQTRKPSFIKLIWFNSTLGLAEGLL